jgi:hypothetical protein
VVQTQGCGRAAARVFAASVIALAAAVTAIAAPRAAANPVAPAPWTSTYDWVGGDGYAGWQSSMSVGAGPYAFGTGVAGQAGLWVWPQGGDFPPAAAHWDYTAPGTTRIARAELTLRFPNRLLSHHCVTVALRAGDGTRDTKSTCTPAPSSNGFTGWTIALDDPAALATILEAGIELPCAKSNTAACVKHIPSAAPEQNGLRVVGARLLLVDDDLPTASASGPLRDLDGQYINGTGSYNVVLDGSDGGSGVRTVALEDRGADLLLRQAACDPGHNTDALGARLCPPSMTSSEVVDTAALSEGTHQFAVRAVDLAGNTGRSSGWSVKVDRTPPAAASEFEASLDPEDGITQLDWLAQGDPPLADGTPGSGVAVERYRYHTPDSAWSEWRDVKDGEATVEGLKLGDEITFETYSIDSVGNRSATVTDTITVAPAVSTSGDWDALWSSPGSIVRAAFSARLSAPSDPAAMAAGDKRRQCMLSGIAPDLTEQGGESDVNLYAFGNYGCPVTDTRFQSMSLTACLDVLMGKEWTKVDHCVTETRKSPQPPIYAIINDVPCVPGTHDYRIRLSAKTRLLIVRDIHVKHTLYRGDLDCNEAGAWRVAASYKISSPSTVLGANLRRVSDFPPADGFAAHHIIPAGFKKWEEATDAERLGYDCGIGPNSAVNGVWLRGPNLFSGPAYDRLPDDGKRRAFHPTLHTRKYFREVAHLLAPLVPKNDECMDRPAARATLTSIAKELEYDVFPFKPGVPLSDGED